MNKRTPEELAKPEFNYFIALGLGVSEKDVSVISAAVRKRLSDTSGSLRARRFKELGEDLTQTMVNDGAARAAEAARAVNFKLDTVMEIVKSSFEANGRIYKSELLELCAEVNKKNVYFTYSELEKRVEEFASHSAVKVIDDTAPFNSNFGLFEKVSALLQVPPIKRDLYDFLDVPTTASEAEIEAACKSKYAEAQRKSDLKLKMSVGAMCGHVRDILLKPDMRTEYDRYIKLRTSVFDKLKLRASNGIGFITASEWLTLLRTVKDTVDVDTHTAELLLGEATAANHLTITLGAGQSPDIKYIMKNLNTLAADSSDNSLG